MSYNTSRGNYLWICITSCLTPTIGQHCPVNCNRTNVVVGSHLTNPCNKFSHFWCRLCLKTMWWIVEIYLKSIIHNCHCILLYITSDSTFFVCFSSCLVGFKSSKYHTKKRMFPLATHFEASPEDDIWKHCGVKINLSFSHSVFIRLLYIYSFIYRQFPNSYRYFFKDVRWWFVIRGKAISKASWGFIAFT